MKPYNIISGLLLAVFALQSIPTIAQSSSKESETLIEIRNNPSKAGGVYYVDPFNERDVTPAPKGYKPYYISMYARHGARYLLSENQYENIHKILVDSKTAGTLTDAGEKFYDKFEALYPSVKGYAGELSPKGAIQHKALARRMYENYPEIFKNHPNILAFSSYLTRTTLSMAAFVDGLREENRDMNITTECSKANMVFLNPYSLNGYPYFNKWNERIKDEDALWRPDYNNMCDSLMDTETFMGKYFKDLSILRKVASLRDLYFDIFDLSCDMGCFDTDLSFNDMFDEKEIETLWECETAEYYYMKGPEAKSYLRGQDLSVTVLRDILGKASEDMNDGNVNVRLRFGHDGCMMGLFSLMKLDTWGVQTTDPYKIKDLWHLWDIPMAANLQFVFYRSKKSSDVLVKVLLNEKNVALPIKAFDGPYYKWSDVLAFYEPVMKAAEERLSDSDKNGAPVILTGKVTVEGKPVAGVKVSDGINIVTTDASGEYKMFSRKEQGFVFVTTPTGYVATSADGIQPDFYAHLTKPAWEKENHDFTLRKEDQNNYSVVFITDLHLTNSNKKPDQAEFRDVAMPFVRSQVSDLQKKGPVYSMNLGDFSHDVYWYKFNYSVADAYNTLKQVQYPTLLYSVSGNHDNDGAVSTSNEDRDAEHLYRQVLGPEYYSIDIGRDHWIMMDDIIYVNTPVNKVVNKIKGERNYVKGFTPDQMKWLENDLKYVSDSTKVYICVHAPLITANEDGRGTTFNRLSQMDSLNTMFARFGKVTVFCGHVHYADVTDSKKFPSFYEYMVPALSGNMWTTTPIRELGTDGNDGGALIGHFKSDTTYFQLLSEKNGPKMLRVYDMNEVGRYYRNDPDIRKQMEMYPRRLDYGDRKYANYVYVNYWAFRPGDSVEVLENGKPLSVSLTHNEDPLFNVNYYVPMVAKGESYTESHSTSDCNHMFIAKARTKTGKILVRIKDSAGTVIYQETMHRPKTFSQSTDE